MHRQEERDRQLGLRAQTRKGEEMHAHTYIFGKYISVRKEGREGGREGRGVGGREERREGGNARTRGRGKEGTRKFKLNDLLKNESDEFENPTVVMFPLSMSPNSCRNSVGTVVPTPFRSLSLHHLPSPLSLTLSLPLGSSRIQQRLNIAPSTATLSVHRDTPRIIHAVRNVYCQDAAPCPPVPRGINTLS